MEFIRQATIDSLWSREPLTVKNNLQEAQQQGRWSAIRFRFPEESVTLPMGPFPLEASCGMKAAMLVLDRSLDPWRYSDYVGWETFRKSRSAIMNISQADVSGLLDVVGAYERNRCWISKVPTHTFWFHRFMVGIHKRAGEIRTRQDEALTTDALHEIDKILEAKWRSTVDVWILRWAPEMGTGGLLEDFTRDSGERRWFESNV
jgi:hypothetical protein